MLRASIFAGLAVCSVPATACILPAPIAPLPHESQQAFHERQKASLAAIEYDSRRSAQIGFLDQSTAVFIGTIATSRDISVDVAKGHEVAIRPLSPIKGSLPDQSVRLRDTVFTGCGLSGGGSATSAQPGDYVIVFEPQNVGIEAKDAVLPDLLTALAIYARDSTQ